MKIYLDMLAYLLKYGKKKDDRTGVGTLSIFGYQNRYNLSAGFPLLTTKKIPFRLIVSELLWFLHGDTNIQYLLEHDNHIWDEWAFEKWINSEAYQGPDMTNFGLRANQDPEFRAQYEQQLKIFTHNILNDNDFAKRFGDLGNIYGKQWRNFEGKEGRSVDQIQQLIENIKTTPDSRRLILTAWNPTEIKSMALPPCHMMCQFYVNDGYLSGQLYQRSADVFLGVPFNIASYALLIHLLAREAGLKAGEFIHTFGDLHLYLNHIEQAKKQLTREPRNLPDLVIKNPDADIFTLKPKDIQVENYTPAPAIKAPVAV